MYQAQFSRVWVLKVKAGRVFKFRVPCSSTNFYQIAFQDPKARWVGNTESTHVRVNLPSQDGSISMLTIIWVFSYSTTTYWSIFSRSSSTLSQIFLTFSIDSEPLIKKYGLTVSLLEDGSRKINLSSKAFLILMKRIPPEIKYAHYEDFLFVLLMVHLKNILDIRAW